MFSPLVKNGFCVCELHWFSRLPVKRSLHVTHLNSITHEYNFQNRSFHGIFLARWLMTNLFSSNSLSATWCIASLPYASVKCSPLGHCCHSRWAMVKRLLQLMHLCNMFSGISNRSSSFFMNSFDFSLSFLSVNDSRDSTSILEARRLTNWLFIQFMSIGSIKISWMWLPE